MTMVKFSKNGEVMRDAFIPGNFANLVENLFNDSFGNTTLRWILLKGKTNLNYRQRCPA